jgi:hypothetical protein
MQLEKWQQELLMIAEIRNSARLKEFVRTCRDRECCSADLFICRWVFDVLTALRQGQPISRFGFR